MNVSHVHVKAMPEVPDAIEIRESVGQYKRLISGQDLQFVIHSATGTKCARCWNFMPEVANYGIWQNVCTRCQAALTEMKIAPPTEEAQ